MHEMTSLIQTFLPYVQIALAIVLTVAVLFQQSEAGLGAGFGADSFSTAHHERRGAEKTLFIATIVIGVLFVISAAASLLVK